LFSREGALKTYPSKLSPQNFSVFALVHTYELEQVLGSATWKWFKPLAGLSGDFSPLAVAANDIV